MAKVTPTKETSKGICRFCGNEVDKTKMTQHLKYCKSRKASIEATNTQEAEKTRLFHIVVEGRYLPMYWMHLEMPTDARLLDLDDFLRDTWLECCGHLSAFTIGKNSYSSQMEEMYWGIPDSDNASEEETSVEETEEEDEEADEELSPIEVIERLYELTSAEFDEKLSDVPLPQIEAKLNDILVTQLGVSVTPEMQSQLGNLAHYLQLSSLVDTGRREYDMEVELGEVLKVGEKFFHEYDFGSTTELALRVVAEREGAEMKDEDGEPLLVDVMARNEPPVIACRVCGKPATKIAAGYFYAQDGALCDTCAKTNRVEYEDMLLPVVNSPRVGVCGYTGDYEYGDEDEWEEEEDEIEEEE